MIPQLTQRTFRLDLRSALVVQSELAPPTMQSGDTIVGLDALLASRTLGGTVAFDPVMQHTLGLLLGLDVGGYAVGRCASRASFVDGVLAEGTGQALLTEAHQHV